MLLFQSIDCLLLMDFQIHKMKCIRLEIRFSDTPTNSNLHKIFFKVNTINGNISISYLFDLVIYYSTL